MVEKKLRNKLRYRAAAADQSLMLLRQIIQETPLATNMEWVLLDWKVLVARIFEETTGA